jgi:hypothetical protein
MRPVAVATILAFLVVLPSLPLTVASDDCDSAGPRCLAAPVSVPCPVANPTCLDTTFYVYAGSVGCPPGSSGCKAGILWQDTNGLTGLQRAYSSVRGHTYPADTDLL